MRHSRDIDDLRADVAANCRALIALAEREGLHALVTETVRDGEYQKMLAKKGYAAAGAVTPSFHADHAGLAFDICKMRRAMRMTILHFCADGRAGEKGRLFVGRRLAELSRPAALSVGCGRSVHGRDGESKALSAADAAI